MNISKQSVSSRIFNMETKMAYKEVRIMEIKEILRRIQSGQSINFISKQTGRDRKTIRKYLNLIKQEGIEPSEIKTNDSELVEKITGIVESTKRISYKQEVFSEYREEIEDLINNPKHRLKIKSAFEVISKRHNLEGKTSYSSFKRYLREAHISYKNIKVTCRIETPPGNQIQVDYGKVGMLYDPSLKRKRSVYAFIGTLSNCRHKYVEFVYKQDQKSFVESHVNMFNFFGGVTETIVIDNLKAGVIKPDLYDPTLNRSYLEMAEHYGCFIDTARVASPKDKPKVERDVQTVREEFKKMQALKGNISLAEANEKIKKWLIEDYGQRKHGTTHQKPFELFREVEQPLLGQLPKESFEVCRWKEAKVHPDCYIQVEKKAYSIPYEFVGKKLFVKVKSRIIEAYFNEKLIKVHRIPDGYRQTDYSDFPDNIQNAVGEGLPLRLQIKAQKISGSNLSALINKLLTPHAYINLRRAQSILTISEKYPPAVVEKAAGEVLSIKKPTHPKVFKKILESLLSEENQSSEQGIALSEQTESFIRKINYFIHN